MKDKKCIRCGLILKAVHSNTKKCGPCRDYLKKYIPTTMSTDQIRIAEKMIGKFTRHQICKKLGVSLANLKRAFRGVRIPWVKEHKNKIMAAEVSAYYEIHGLRKTEEKYPDLRIRSIVEKYKLHSPRQKKWKDSELVELVKMSHFVSHKSQAKYLGRPNANAGSITSGHRKRIFKGINKSNIHGLYEHKAKHFVDKKCPIIPVRDLMRKSEKSRKLHLWVDMEKYLRTDCPESIKLAIKTGADFQRWLFNSKNPRRDILRIIRERK